MTITITEMYDHKDLDVYVFLSQRIIKYTIIWPKLSFIKSI